MKKQILILIGLCLILSSCPSPQNTTGENKIPEWWEQYNIETWNKGAKIEPFTLKDLEGTWIVVWKNGGKYLKREYVYTYNTTDNCINYSCNEFDKDKLTSSFKGTITVESDGVYKSQAVAPSDPAIPQAPPIYYKYEVYQNCIIRNRKGYLTSGSWTSAPTLFRK